jgi:uncharacterized protein involved in type VI secretion and phage assembly
MRNRSGLVNGVVIGIVKSIQAGGQIEVEYPWLPDQPRSALAPVAAPLSGGQRGMFFMPEPEDEALVAFEHGDFDHPFIVGFLWNGRDKPPESDRKNRVILTPGGHTLRFEDNDNAKKIVIKSSGGLEIILDDTGPSIELNGGGRSLVLKNGQVQIS